MTWIFLTGQWLLDFVDMGYASWRYLFLAIASKGMCKKLSAEQQFFSLPSFSRLDWIIKKGADNSSSKSACYRLCVCASGSLITEILNCVTLISVSCLHFGQKRGKFSSTVSSRIFNLVLLWQIGQNAHWSSIFSPAYPTNYSNNYFNNNANNMMMNMNIILLEAIHKCTNRNT